MTSTKRVLTEILARCDASGVDLESECLVPGWHTFLHKCFRNTITQAAGSTSAITRTIDDLFAQVRQYLVTVNSGPSAFKAFLRVLTTHFDTGDQGRAFERLLVSGAPSGTAFSVYVRAFRELVSAVQGTEKVVKPSETIVLEKYALV